MSRMADRKLWKKTLGAKGTSREVVVRAPEPMTKEEWVEWKKSPEGAEAFAKARRVVEIRKTPTWSHWQSVYGYADNRTIDRKTEGDLSRVKATKDVGTGDKCQFPDGVAPSYKTHFKGNWYTFKRVAIFPNTPHGKKLAQQQAERIREGEGFRRDIHTSEKNKTPEEIEDNQIISLSDHEVDRQVRVLLVHCKDVPKPAKYWTVWVGRSQSQRTSQSGELGEARLATYQEGLRTDALYRSGLRGKVASKKGYQTGATKNIRSVACPKCEAPVGENCTGQYQYDEAQKLYAEGKLTRKQARSGNPHRARIKLYESTLEEKEENENGEEV